MQSTTFYISLSLKQERSGLMYLVKPNTQTFVLKHSPKNKNMKYLNDLFEQKRDTLFNKHLYKVSGGTIFCNSVPWVLILTSLVIPLIQFRGGRHAPQR